MIPSCRRSSDRITHPKRVEIKMISNVPPRLTNRLTNQHANQHANMQNPSSQSNPAFLEKILRQAARLVNTEHSYLYSLDQNTNRLVATLVTGMFEPDIGFSVTLGQGLGGKVWESGEAILVADYHAWDGKAAHYTRSGTRASLRSAVGVPLKQRGQVIGVLGLAHTEANAFDQSTVALLTDFAEIASLALENSQSSEFKFTQHLENVPLAVIELNLEGNVTRWNATAEVMFGYSSEEILGSPLADRITGNALQTQVNAILELTVRERRTVQSVNTNHTKSGQLITCEWIDSPIFDLQGNVIGISCLARDVSTSRRSEDRVRALEMATDSASDAVTIIELKPDDLSADPEVIYVNDAYQKLMGFTSDQLLRTIPRIRSGPQTDLVIAKQVVQAFHDNAPIHTELLEYTSDGTPVWIEFSALSITDAAGRWSHRVSWRRDIRARKRAESLNDARNRLLEMLLRGETLEGVFGHLAQLLEEQWGGFCTVSVFEEGMFRFLGTPSLPAQVRDTLNALELGRYYGDWLIPALEHGLIVTDDIAHDPDWVSIRDMAGQLGVQSIWCAPIRSGEGALLGMITCAFRDAQSPGKEDHELLEMAQRLGAVCMEHRQMAAQIAFQAQHDTLTQLPNRALLNERLELAIARALRRDEHIALLFIDLDGFKQVNDSLGHAVGDELLRSITDRLGRGIRSGDTLARIGGDEFALLLPDLTTTSDAARIAEGMLNLFQTPFALEDHEVYLTASIGIAIFPNDGSDAATLLQHSDTAMYRAKHSGKNTFSSFDPVMTTSALRRREIEHALRQALPLQEFELHYQAQVDLQGQACGVEALLRWNSPSLGWVSPAEFIPIAESTGLIIAMDAWVMRQACQQAVHWQRSGLPPFNMAVNISALQFTRPDFVQSIREVLLETGLEAKWLELELTESVFMHDIEVAIARMHQIRALGVNLSIDDFGTGYSSLSYLQRLPVNAIKVDQSFVHDLMPGTTSHSLVQAIVLLGKQFQITVVIEGIETVSQLETLRALGCDRLQGFYFCKPCPPETLEAWLRTLEAATVARA
jgi:diguanylate cyclase (GGDEF)-like protein/PAS domain S-box-containing protein